MFQLEQSRVKGKLANGRPRIGIGEVSKAMWQALCPLDLPGAAGMCRA